MRKIRSHIVYPRNNKGYKEERTSLLKLEAHVADTGIGLPLPSRRLAWTN